MSAVIVFCQDFFFNIAAIYKYNYRRSARLYITKGLQAGAITAESATQIVNANMKLDEQNPHFLKYKIKISKLQAPVFCLPYDLF